jgi:hypothetical protein
MNVRIWLAVILMVGFSSALGAQGHVEISPFASFSLSEGAQFQPQLVNGVSVDELVPRSGFSYGFQLDYMDERNGWGFGFQYSDQFSKLEAGGTELTDMNVRNYHGIFTYSVGEEEDTVRPYMFGGLGMTNYSFSEIAGNAISGENKFSSTWGGGVKVFTSRHVGFRLTGRWTPTYVSTDSSGMFCSAAWTDGCWVTNQGNYANQFELGGGLVLRF